MKNLSKKFSSGLTLIELLVVVAILGILAAVLLAAVDPVEQQLKATDAVAENTAVEWVQANARYYGTKQAYPWNQGGISCYGGATGTATLAHIVLPTLMASNTGAAGTCLSGLTGSGELKSSFSNIDTNSILSKIVVNQPSAPGASTTSISSCYAPQSKAQKNANTTVYNNDGSSGCVPGPATTCYFCAF